MKKLCLCAAMFGILAGNAPPQPGEANQPVLEGVTVELLPIAKLNNEEFKAIVGTVEEVAAKFYAWEIAKTDAQSDDPVSSSISEGWVDSNVYLRINEDRLDFYSRGPTRYENATFYCRVTVSVDESSSVFPEAYPKWFVDLRKCAPKSNKLLGLFRRNVINRGKPSATKRFQLDNGRAVNVSYMKPNRGGGLLPLPGEVKLRMLHTLPARRDQINKSAYRYAVAHFEDGVFALLAEFPRYGSSNGGCVISDKHGTFPRREWITEEVREWCVERAGEYESSLPKQPIPLPAPAKKAQS